MGRLAGADACPTLPRPLQSGRTLPRRPTLAAWRLPAIDPTARELARTLTVGPPPFPERGRGRLPATSVRGLSDAVGPGRAVRPAPGAASPLDGRADALGHLGPEGLLDVAGAAQGRSGREAPP